MTWILDDRYLLLSSFCGYTGDCRGCTLLFLWPGELLHGGEMQEFLLLSRKSPTHGWRDRTSSNTSTVQYSLLSSLAIRVAEMMDNTEKMI